MNKIKSISVLEYNKLSNILRYLFILITAFLIVVIIFQALTIQNIRSEIQEKVYVSVGSELYSAIPSENESSVSKDMLINHSKLFMFNMFSHDQYNFEQRTNWGGFLCSKKDYNFIMAGFVNNEQNIFKLYQKYDARTYFELDSISVNDSKDHKVFVYGKQKAVFGFGQTTSTDLNCEFVINKVDRSENNPYGLQINDFNFIK